MENQVENKQEHINKSQTENKGSYLDAAAQLTMEELESLSFTKIVKDRDGHQDFIGLGILDKNGYLLEYNELKKVYAGLNYFIRNANPTLIKKMNDQQYQAEKMEMEKDELIELISKNIVDKEEWQEEFEEEEVEKEGFFSTIKKFFSR